MFGESYRVKQKERMQRTHNKGHRRRTQRGATVALFGGSRRGIRGGIRGGSRVDPVHFQGIRVLDMGILLRKSVKVRGIL